MSGPSVTTPPATESPATGFRTRFLLLKFFFALFFVIIGFRLVTIQVLEAGRYRDLARKQYEQRFVLPAVRGTIEDRNGNVLASNTMYVSFAADPKIVGDDSRKVATAFARVFGRSSGYYLERLGGPNGSDKKRFVWMERSVRPEVARRVELAHLPGVVMMNEPKRLYYYDHVAGTLIGFTDIDHRGISGMEMSFDADLRGTDGAVMLQRDGLGRSRPSADYPRVEPVNGRDLRLTIDIEYQAVAEEELRRGLEANEADGGLAVLMNPRTGEILALAVAPGVNPNSPGSVDAALARNRVVTDIFEPGSVFKIVTAGAAYEHGLVKPDDRFYGERGSMKVTIGKYVRTIKDTHEHEWLTFRGAMEVSSNIVMAKVGKIIGSDKLYRMARDFGFGVPTGVDIPGEVRGALKRPTTWSGTTLQTISYGYEVGVTPLQMLAAYGAVANGGVLVRPYVVRSVRTPAGDEIRTQSTTVIRRVISPETAKLLTEALEGVVERGTAMDVRISGVRIAGKTGTARKVVDGKYATGSYTASFAGFFPADDPQVVGVVMMDNPRKHGYYGGITSGPVFHAIAERIVNSSSKISRTVVAQRDPSRDRVLSVPDVRSMQPEFARRMLASLGLEGRTYGQGTLVVRQMPEAERPAQAGDVVTLVLGTAAKPSADGLIAVPAYGSGSFEIANVLQFHQVDYLTVAYADEGVELRKAGIKLPIMVMNPDEESFDAMLKYQLEPEIYSFRVLKMLEAALLRLSPASPPVGIHIKIDTGMHRLGFDPIEIDELINQIKDRPQIKVKSVFSHLAASDSEKNDDFTRHQISLFRMISERINFEFEYPILRHIANTAAISRFPEARFEMVRLGIGLYGIAPMAEEQTNLENVSTLRSIISQIKHILPEDTVGYNRRYKAKNETTIAIVPIGYADGLSRALSNGIGHLKVNGKFAPVVGSICMDMTMIDITNINAREGDEVIIFGKDLPITRLADEMGSIPYEILTGISQRVKRVYYQE